MLYAAQCDAADLGCQCTRRPGDSQADRLLLFERRRGGVGLAGRLLGTLPALLRAAQARLEGCACAEGCPACVHKPQCGEYNEGLDKEAARLLLRWLLQREEIPTPDPEEPAKAPAEAPAAAPGGKRAKTAARAPARGARGRG